MTIKRQQYLTTYSGDGALEATGFILERILQDRATDDSRLLDLLLATLRPYLAMFSLLTQHRGAQSRQDADTAIKQFIEVSKRRSAWQSTLDFFDHIAACLETRVARALSEAAEVEQTAESLEELCSIIRNANREGLASLSENSRLEAEMLISSLGRMEADHWWYLFYIDIYQIPHVEIARYFNLTLREVNGRHSRALAALSQTLDKNYREPLITLKRLRARRNSRPVDLGPDNVVSSQLLRNNRGVLLRITSAIAGLDSHGLHEFDLFQCRYTKQGSPVTTEDAACNTPDQLVSPSSASRASSDDILVRNIRSRTGQISTSKPVVWVVTGGLPAEREASCRSAISCIGRLARLGYNIRVVVFDEAGCFYVSHVLPPTLDNNLASQLKTDIEALPQHSPKADSSRFTKFSVSELGIIAEIDIPYAAYVLVHGVLGEDGHLQAYLRMIGVPVVGTEVLGSAICSHKPFSKSIAATLGIRVAEHMTYDLAAGAPPSAIMLKNAGVQPPWIVKSIIGGSSYGLSKRSASTAEELWEAMTIAHRAYEQISSEFMVERFIIKKREYTCSALDYHGTIVPSPVTLIATPHPITVEDKLGYPSDTVQASPTQRIVSNAVEDSLFEPLQLWTTLLHSALKCQGVSRSDFVLEEDTGYLYYLETNSIPGYSEGFFLERMWAASGFDLDTIVEAVLASRIPRYVSKALRPWPATPAEEYN